MKTKIVTDYLSVDKSDKTFGIEVGFTTDSVSEVYERAISFGAKSIPTEMPWGQTVSYIKSPDGTLVEICSAIRR